MKIVEPKQSETAKVITRKRYLMTDRKGRPVETVGEMLWRVAEVMAKPEVLWSNNNGMKKIAQQFYERMVSLKFVCSGKAMYEAGNPATAGQLSACFVLPIEDSIDSIFKTLGEAAVVHKNNGGTGFNFSKIRPHGDRVKNVLGAASGPVDFIKAFSAALSKILQGAKRRGGNMAILNCDHPDIEEFIRMKQANGNLKNFNISVGASNEFMKAVLSRKKWSLINPRTRKVVKKVEAKRIFAQICQSAWQTGDPGMIWLDRINQDNPTPSLGRIEATNPCGEIPLLAYESCNLGSINLVQHLKKNSVDWQELRKTIRLGVRFLDNMIEVNNYPLPQVERMVKDGNRRIGLGVMGFAHLLYRLGIAYDSAKAVKLAEGLARFISREAAKESERLGKIRGNFPNYDLSVFAARAKPRRNCALTTVAPTGTISLFSDCSSGIEPVFSLLSLRKTFFEANKDNRASRELSLVDPVFLDYLNSNLKPASLKKKVLEQVAREGTVRQVKAIPLSLRRVWVTANEIDWVWHVRIQAAWQKYFDNSVSKTINLPAQATVEAVKKAYLLAWKLGCKGITVYRDSSQADQVLVAAREICPECGESLEIKEGCAVCLNCGWGRCEI
jgi:ribonucleoside-diphosphate reductase alpha chain